MKRTGERLRIGTIKTALAIGLPAMVLGVAVGSAAADIPPPSPNCMQDIYLAGGGSGSLNCNSNDVRLAKADNIRAVKGIFTGADGKFSCLQGDDIEFYADFTVKLGATGSVRYDIGLYLADLTTPGQKDAKVGTCNSGVIPTTSTAKNNLDGDGCGDITGVVGSQTNPQVVNLHISTKCTANTVGLVTLPNCTSWRQPGSNTTCNGIKDAFPGSPSKCNCDDTLDAPISVVVPAITVEKYANDVKTLNIDEPGGPVTYTVKIHNSSPTDSVTIAELKEDEFGDGTSVTTYSTSSAPTLLSLCTDIGGTTHTTTIAPCGSNATSCAAASTIVCSFTRNVTGGPQSVTDKACVSGSSNRNAPVGPTCSTATVNIVGVAPSLSVKEVPIRTVETFAVSIQNTSTAEVGTLKAICDDVYGPIVDPDPTNSLCTGTSRIISTTCGTNATGAGTLPMDLAINGNTGDTYTCVFQAEVPNDGQVHNATVKAYIADDDGNVITGTSNATVQVSTTPAPQ